MLFRASSHGFFARLFPSRRWDSSKSDNDTPSQWKNPFKCSVLQLLTNFPTGCNSQVEKATGSKSGEDAQDENGDQNQDKEGRTINKTTLRLDWVLGDDPSQVAIPVSPPPRLDTPAFDIPSTVPEAPEFSLGTILEREEKPQAIATSREAMVGTWPRMRRLIYGACETPERNVSMESFISASTSNGLDSAVSKSSSEALDSSNISKSSKETVTQGTQTECSMVTAHETEQKGRWMDATMWLLSSVGSGPQNQPLAHLG